MSDLNGFLQFSDSRERYACSRKLCYVYVMLCYVMTPVRQGLARLEWRVRCIATRRVGWGVGTRDAARRRAAVRVACARYERCYVMLCYVGPRGTVTPPPDPSSAPVIHRAYHHPTQIRRTQDQDRVSERPINIQTERPIVQDLTFERWESHDPLIIYPGRSMWTAGYAINLAMQLMHKRFAPNMNGLIRC